VDNDEHQISLVWNELRVYEKRLTAVESLAESLRGNPEVGIKGVVTQLQELHDDLVRMKTLYPLFTGGLTACSFIIGLLAGVKFF
jgi:hypothetical protein